MNYCIFVFTILSIWFCRHLCKILLLYPFWLLIFIFFF